VDRRPIERAQVGGDQALARLAADSSDRLRGVALRVLRDPDAVFDLND
jgi:hypothetical protein